MKTNFWQKMNVTGGEWKGLHGDGVDRRGNVHIVANSKTIAILNKNESANAQIIATAPEMAEALIEVLIRREEEYEGLGGPLWDERFSDDYGHLIAILEKAFGRPWAEIKGAYLDE